MNYVIFAIDNNEDFHNVAKFMRHIDTQKALGKLKGNIVENVGYWEGIMETSYTLREEDYMEFVVSLGYTQNQDCVLVLTDNPRQPAHLADSMTLAFKESVGIIKQISAEEAKASDAWTYNKTSGKYFAAA